MFHAGEIREAVKRALAEDRVGDDVTTRSVLGGEPPRGTARLFAKQAGIFSGVAVCEVLDDLAKGALRIRAVKREGEAIGKDETCVELEGDLGLCLSFERTLLNFLCHACGVATETRRFVEAVHGTKTKILATRKTLPGLRAVELAAVVAGGGVVHRRSLSDGILVKDNHWELAAKGALERIRAVSSPLHGIEIEVDRLEKLDEALAAGPDVIMLDNMARGQLVEAISRIGGRCRVEISGGVRLDEARELAELGVDYLSVGRLTHSAPSLDLSLDITGVEGRAWV